MAAESAHHWMALMLIASVAGGTLGGTAGSGSPPTITQIAPWNPSLAHNGLPSTCAQATDEPSAAGPYRAASAESVACQPNGCCSDTSKTISFPPSSTAAQGLGGLQAAAALNSATRMPGNISLARTAPTGQPREMNAHREPRPIRRPHGGSPSREPRATTNSTLASPNPYTVARPHGCCLLGPPCYRGSGGSCIIKVRSH